MANTRVKRCGCRFADWGFGLRQIFSIPLHLHMQLFSNSLLAQCTCGAKVHECNCTTLHRRCIRCIRCISLHLCNTPLPLVFYIFLGLTRCQYTEGFALKNWRSSHMHLMHLMHLRCKGAKVQRCEAGVKKLAKVVHQRCKKQAVWASLHPLPPHHLSCTCGAHSPVLWCIWKLLHTVTLLLCTFGARITITMHLWCKGVCIKEV